MNIYHYGHSTDDHSVYHQDKQVDGHCDDYDDDQDDDHRDDEADPICKILYQYICTIYMQDNISIYMYKVVQLSLQPHSRRLATLGLQTINFCLCLTVIGWRYYFHTRHHHHHQYVNIIIKRWQLCIRPLYWNLCGSIGERAWRH